MTELKKAITESTIRPNRTASDDSHFIETYKSLIAISIEGFKYCMLVNGGAAVALLAYLGNFASKTSASAPTPDMRFPMAAFLIGLVSCGIAMVLSYWTQLRVLEESRTGTLELRHKCLLRAAAIFVSISILCFSLGAWQAVIRFHP